MDCQHAYTNVVQLLGPGEPHEVVDTYWYRIHRGAKPDAYLKLVIYNGRVGFYDFDSNYSVPDLTVKSMRKIPFDVAGWKAAGRGTATRESMLGDLFRLGLVGLRTPVVLQLLGAPDKKTFRETYYYRVNPGPGWGDDLEIEMTGDKVKQAYLVPCHVLRRRSWPF